MAGARSFFDAPRLAAITPDMLDAALDGLIPYASEAQARRRWCRRHYEAPTGNRHPIDYEGEGAPILAIRVQELFGLTAASGLADGRLPLTLHLLSPARPADPDHA